MEHLEKIAVTRCENCALFNDEGYDNPNPELPELRTGWCAYLHRDVQACNYCSFAQPDRNENDKEQGIVTLYLDKDDCKNAADMLELYFFDNIRDDPDIDNIRYVESIIRVIHELNRAAGEE